MKKILWTSAVVLGLVSGCALVARPDLSPNAVPASAAGVYFVEPLDGVVVASPFKVKFGVKGMEVKPAGVQVAESGHHHLLIDRGSVAAGQVIPMDETYLHFGKGQTETEVKLPPGIHKLTMQFADGNHVSYGPQMSTSLTVTVR